MPETNPFLVLGLTLEGLRGLTDEQILTLVSDTYRARVKICHPDRGGKAEVFGQVTRAYEQITAAAEKPGEFVFLRKQFLRPKKKPTKSIVSESQSDFANPRSLPDFWEAWIKREQKNEPTLFNCRSLTLLMIDVMASQFGSVSPGGLTIKVPGGESGAFNLFIDEEGKLTRQPVVRRRLDVKKQGQPPWPSRWWNVSRMPQNSYYWGTDGPPKSMDGLTILGSIDSDVLRGQAELVQNFAGLLEGDRSADTYRNVMAGFTWETFRPYGQLMSPAIRRDKFLIGGRLDADGCLIFHVLGRALGFHLGALPKWSPKLLR